jgi:hypothetical protein
MATNFRNNVVMNLYHRLRKFIKMRLLELHSMYLVETDPQVVPKMNATFIELGWQQIEAEGAEFNAQAALDAVDALLRVNPDAEPEPEEEENEVYISTWMIL